MGQNKVTRIKSYIDFILGCFVAPSFLIALFFIYLKFLAFSSTNFDIEYYDLLQAPLEFFIAFIDKAYELTFEAFIEFIVWILGVLTNIFGFNISFQFPDWYSTAAYFSTIIYGSQSASMKLFQPVIGNSKDGDEAGDPEIGNWARSLLTCIWRFLLIIYIPVNQLSLKIKELIDLEYFSGKKASRIFKIVTLGFFMMGFLFLVYDLLWMIFHRHSESGEAIQHRRFYMAILVAFLTALIFTIFSVFILSKDSLRLV